MHYRDIAKALIERHEGRRLKAYDDATGKPVKSGDTVRGHVTIGVGRNIGQRGLSDAEVDIMLANDLADGEAAAAAFAGPAWEKLNDVRKAVVIDMAHHLGMPKLMMFARARRAVQDGDFDAAASEMLDSDAARKHLVRWAELADLMRAREEIPSV
jgi:lysozyme